MFKRAILFLVSIALALQAEAGAWLQPQGKGLFIGSATYFASDQYFDVNSRLKSQDTYRKYAVQPYVEYGLLPNLTIGGNAELQQDTQSGDGNTGVADPEFFLRTTVWKGERQLVSLQPLVKFSSVFAREGSPRGGSRSYDAELSLLYGRNLNLLSSRDFLDVRAGYRLRANRLNDQFRGDVALGLEVMPNLQLIPAIRGITATKIEKNQVFSENGDQDYDLLRAEVTAAYRLNPAQTASVTLFDHVKGVQTGNGMGITLSFAQAF